MKVSESFDDSTILQYTGFLGFISMPPLDHRLCTNLSHILQELIQNALQKKSLLVRTICPRKNSNIVAKDY